MSRREARGAARTAYIRGELAKWRTEAVEALADPAESRATPEQTRRDRRRIKELERELRRKDKALAESAALLVLSKKALCGLPERRGRMIRLEDRCRIVEAVDEAHRGARLAPACELAGIDIRTLQRWRASGGLEHGDRRSTAKRPPPSNALSETERRRLLEVANEPRFAEVPPARIVPALADEGVYLASESSFYRVLREHGQSRHRGRAKTPQAVRAPTTHVARAPNEVWCWDLTYLPAKVTGLWYYLYVILDLDIPAEVVARIGARPPVGVV